MKTKLLIICAAMFLLVNAILVSAYTTTTFTQQSPYSDTFTPQTRNGISTSALTSALNFKSCTIDANWQTKKCQYLYWCYAILPTTSTKISDALQKECQDISASGSTATLSVSNFVPPVGVLYYVTTFVTVVNYTYSDSSQSWSSAAYIPTQYINATAVRSICPSGQMLWLNQLAGTYQCKNSQRVCFDTALTGLCTNAYNIYALDLGSGFDISNGNSLCADRNDDKICDLVSSLGCVDVCSKYNTAGSCIASGANGLCDSDDQAAVYSCTEGSIHTRVCASIDSALCNTIYTPVCVAKTSGTLIGGQTYPNSCFAITKGFSACTVQNATGCYSQGACQPPVTQCYVASDCPDVNVCKGPFPITKQCLGNTCSYSGTCGNLACNVDSDCTSLTMPCVGVSAKCLSNVCTVQGTCVTKPTPSNSIWDLIGSAWTNFWNWVKGIFGA